VEYLQSRFRYAIDTAENETCHVDDRRGNEGVPIQLAQCWFTVLAISNAKILISLYFFRIKYTEAILSNRTRKLLPFEITKMLVRK